MDYRFYTQLLGKVPTVLFQNLVAEAQTLDYGSNISFKNRDKFDSFRKDDGQYDGSAFEQCVFQVIDWLERDVGVFAAKDLAAYEVNRIFPGGKLVEHTDLYGPLRSGYKVCLSHKVHIPLQSNGAFHLHRRAKLTEPVKSVLEEGYAYCYNNYVWHSAHNHGTDTRLEMTLLFWDRDWAYKNKVYDLNGLVGDGY